MGVSATFNRPDRNIIKTAAYFFDTLEELK
jgi:hypothetical protein